MSTSTPSTSHGAGTVSTAFPASGSASPVATANAADAATDSPAAIEAGIKANDDRAFEESLGAMSPFEVKNLLVKMAKKGDEGTTRTLLNAGRGNPNWITTLPREAFFLLGSFAMEEARRTMDEPDYDLAGMPAADGAAARFLAFLDEHGREKPAQFLKRAWDYLDAEGLAGDELVHEWTGGIAGDEYPMPDRILRYTQEIVNRYLVKALDDGHAPATPYDLFATEGGTAAMCYLFYSLKCNFLVNPGDHIALMTPIFTPYLNIPTLNDYDLDVTYIQANTIDADGLHTWQYPDSELEKLRDPSIKLLCLVNPSNPPSVALDDASARSVGALDADQIPLFSPVSADPVVQAVRQQRYTGDYTAEMLLAELSAALMAADDAEVILPGVEATMHLLELLVVIGGADMAPAALSLVYQDEAAGARAGLDWTRAEVAYGHPASEEDEDWSAYDDEDGCGHDHFREDHDYDDYDDFAPYNDDFDYSSN